MISRDEYLMGRDKIEAPTDEMLRNCVDLLQRVNRLLVDGGFVRGVRSGYRPAEINAKVPNAAPHSKHMTCQAVDLEDNDGKLKSWCLKNLAYLDQVGLWMEAPEATPTWCHLQNVPPGSGHRVFFP